MHRRTFLATATSIEMSPTESNAAPEQLRCDVFVYGSTPGGVTAAIEAARRGARIVLACPQKHPGGMAVSGLSTMDAVRPQLFRGQVAEFIAGVRKYYQTALADKPTEYALTREGGFTNRGWLNSCSARC